ncbi:MAG: apolipoprotein D and lipocalin family protein [Bacteriovoracaceae bacterium]|jgi:apolipoprotein D and lipocalin family protein
MLKYLFLMVVIMSIFGCSSSKDFYKTVDSVDMNRFMDRWYVIGGRLTTFEDGAHNAIESYSWNEKENRVDIDFTMRVDSFDGKLKSIPQKGWIQNSKTNAHWKISPFWPLKFNYLIIDLAEDYSWTVIGVPSQKWVWIMAKDWNMNPDDFDMIVSRIESMGYSTKDIIKVPQKW